MRTIAYSLFFLFLSKDTSAQTSGIFTIEKPDAVIICKFASDETQTIILITDKFCDPIYTSVLDSNRIIFYEKDCVDGPCTVWSAHFKNKILKTQNEGEFFPPKKPDRE